MKRKITLLIIWVITIISWVLINNRSYNRGYDKGAEDMFFAFADTVTKVMDYHISEHKRVGIIQFEGDTNRYIIQKKDLQRKN